MLFLLKNSIKNNREGLLKDLLIISTNCKKTQYKETALKTVGGLFLTLHLVAYII